MNDSYIPHLGSVLLVKRLGETAKLPLRGTEGSAGLDLCSCDFVLIPPKTRKLVSTGISVKVPIGTFGSIRSRSSLALKGIDVEGGVIDSDYTNVIGVIVSNNSDIDFIINRGDRIAQLIIQPYLRPTMVVEKNGQCHVVSDLLPNAKVRGNNGFGSTGIN
jgi:dUTP pyrophosphatase